MASSQSSSNYNSQRPIIVKCARKNALMVTGGAAGERLKGVQVVKPILYGSVALPLGDKQRSDGHTHQWTVYLKSYLDDDMSVYVKRVQFKLHHSYENPNRVVYAPPYSFTETGWGEFRIDIRIYFNDTIEKPATLYHYLKLFDHEIDGSVKTGPDPIYSELYDELVFMEPSPQLHDLLVNPIYVPSVMPQLRTHYEDKKVQDLQKILEAKQKIKEEIEEVKAKLKAAKANIAELKSQAEK